MISLRKVGSALAVAAALLTTACTSTETATTEPLTPAKLSVVGANTATAPASFPVASPFTVVLTTKSGRPVSGRVVHFTISSGGSLSNDSSFTDEKGEASVGVTVGAVGDYTVTATSPGVAAVTFTATATAPVATTLLAGDGNNQAGLANEALAPLKAVVLKSDGTPAVGVSVTFTVTAGGGSVSPGTVVTDANGVAATTFTIGASGTQTVAVTSAGLPSATFTASVADPCIAARPLAIPQTLNRSLDAADCKLATNRYIEFFDVPVAAPFVITESSTAFVPSFAIRSGADTVAFHTPTTSPASFKAFLGAGTYRVGASSSAALATGAYTLSTTSSPSTVTGCERVYINRGGASGAQTLAATDCPLTYDDGNGFGAQAHYADRYRIFMKAGDKITVTMTGSFDLMIRVTDLATGIVTVRDVGGPGGTEVLSFTAATSGQYFIEAADYNGAAGGVPPDTGPYTLTVQ